MFPYTMAKWGVVALTRSFGSRNNIYSADGIKCYALCPSFVDTPLVRGIPFVQDKGIEELERRVKSRVMKSSEVAAAMAESLRRDISGTCYGILPDVPLVQIPDANSKVLAIQVIAGKILGIFGVRTVTFPMAMGTILVAMAPCSFLSALGIRQIIRRYL